MLCPGPTAGEKWLAAPTASSRPHGPASHTLCACLQWNLADDRFLPRRLLKYIVLLLLASFLTFTLTSYSFDPFDSLESRNPRPQQDVIDDKAAELDLDRPIPVRYVRWASGAVRGDFGTTVGGQPMSNELARRSGSACGS